jgi:6-pyruvoyltetrahydropterin/6-carboxytetrahydropterin synthase
VRGSLDENSYVIDFIALRDALRRLVDELDHRVLLPTQHPQIRVTWDERETTAVFEDRRWVFPRDDCALLPVANTTAELIARYLGQRLLDDLEQRTGVRPHFMRLGIDENFGQWGFCELEGE